MFQLYLCCSIVNKCPSGGKQVGGGGVQRQLTSSKGPERIGNSTPWKRDRHPCKGIFFLYFLFQNDAPVRNCLCVQNKKEFSVQVKHKPRVGIRNMPLFLVHQSSWWQTVTRRLSYMPVQLWDCQTGLFQWCDRHVQLFQRRDCIYDCSSYETLIDDFTLSYQMYATYFDAWVKAAGLGFRNLPG